jgi:hypothetical protein
MVKQTNEQVRTVVEDTMMIRRPTFSAGDDSNKPIRKPKRKSNGSTAFSADPIVKPKKKPKRPTVAPTFSAGTSGKSMTLRELLQKNNIQPTPARINRINRQPL